MKRINQSLNDLLSRLSVLTTEWRDDFSQKVLHALDELPEQGPVTLDSIEALLHSDYETAITLFQLFLDRSKDEFTYELKILFPEDVPPTSRGFLNNPSKFVQKLEEMGLVDAINDYINRPVSWKDIIAERLKGGRGSAVKGQFRGKALEDFVEQAIVSVFGKDDFDVRCSFTGKDGMSTAKSDFAIPSKESPSILVEVKAFGATGSKQTNVIGDAKVIVDEKRQDTFFLLVTDGVSWHARQSDLKGLLRLQNEGYVYRIYTKSMEQDLVTDLQQMKTELGL